MVICHPWCMLSNHEVTWYNRACRPVSQPAQALTSSLHQNVFCSRIQGLNPEPWTFLYYVKHSVLTDVLAMTSMASYSISWHRLSCCCRCHVGEYYATCWWLLTHTVHKLSRQCCESSLRTGKDVRSIPQWSSCLSASWCPEDDLVSWGCPVFPECLVSTQTALPFQQSQLPFGVPVACPYDHSALQSAPSHMGHTCNPTFVTNTGVFIRVTALLG